MSMRLDLGECPKCKGDLEHGCIEIIDEGVYYPVKCNTPDCDFEGKEHYNLEFVGYWDNDGNEMD